MATSEELWRAVKAAGAKDELRVYASLELACVRYSEPIDEHLASLRYWQPSLFRAFRETPAARGPTPAPAPAKSIREYRRDFFRRGKGGRHEQQD